MPNTILRDYPTGQVQIGASDLATAASAKVSFKNNGKLVHTLRESPSGFVKGTRECDGSIETVIPATGPEYNYASKINAGAAVQFRFKVPGQPFVIEGRFTSLDLEIPLGDTIKLNLTFTGAFVPQD